MCRDDIDATTYRQIVILCVIKFQICSAPSSRASCRVTTPGIYATQYRVKSFVFIHTDCLVELVSSVADTAPPSER